MLGLRPESIADAGLQPTRAALALVRGGTGDTQRLQATHADGGIEASATCQPGIDYHAHAFDGQAGFGDVGSQHHLALARRRGSQRGVLLFQGQIAVQRQNPRGRRQRAFFQQALRAVDFSLPWQEHQHIARFLLQGACHYAGSHACYVFIGASRRAARVQRVAIVSGDWKSPPVRRYHRGRAEQGRDGRCFQRCRHHQDSQILTHVVLNIQAQGQGQIRVQAALVEFIEDDAGDAFQRGIALQPAGQQCFGQHFDASRCADLRLQARAVADGLAHWLSQQLCHAVRYGTGREPAGLEHDDLA